MSDANGVPPEAEPLLAELRRLRKTLGLPEGKERQEAYARRLGLFQKLRDLGVPDAVVAEAFGVSRQAIPDALRKAREGQQSWRAGAPGS